MLPFEPAPDGTALRADLDNSQRETLHLWRVYLREEPANIRQLSCLLRTEERERAARFVTEPLRARFTVCRAALRSILAGYLSVGPLEVEFSQSSLEALPSAQIWMVPAGFTISDARLLLEASRLLQQLRCIRYGGERSDADLES